MSLVVSIMNFLKLHCEQLASYKFVQGFPNMILFNQHEI